MVRRRATRYRRSRFLSSVVWSAGLSHKVSVYGVDWDSTTRAERLDVLNASNGAVLDSRSLSSFNGGVYLSWMVSGHVQVRVRSEERRVGREGGARSEPQAGIGSRRT